MTHPSAAQTALPIGDPSQEAIGWDAILLAAFADPDRESELLPQAEEAVRAWPRPAARGQRTSDVLPQPDT
jgi:hypothetical protein